MVIGTVFDTGCDEQWENPTFFGDNRDGICAPEGRNRGKVCALRVAELAERPAEV